MMNSISVVGRLGNDPELKYGQSGGKAYCRLSLAVDRDYKENGEKVTDWFEVTVFEKQAEFCAEYMKKGGFVGAYKGSVSYRTYEGRDGGTQVQLEIKNAQVCMAGGHGDGGGQQQERRSGGSQAVRSQKAQTYDDAQDAFADE